MLSWMKETKIYWWCSVQNPSRGHGTKNPLACLIGVNALKKLIGVVSKHGSKKMIFCVAEFISFLQSMSDMFAWKKVRFYIRFWYLLFSILSLRSQSSMLFSISK